MRNKGWWALGLLLCVGVGVYGSRKSWESFWAKSADHRKVQKRVDALEADLVKTEIDLARSSDPVGRERLARQRGYRKPGESPVVLDP
jgi:hypothetical protein